MALAAVGSERTAVDVGVARDALRAHLEPDGGSTAARKLTGLGLVTGPARRRGVTANEEGRERRAVSKLRQLERVRRVTALTARIELPEVHVAVAGAALGGDPLVANRRADPGRELPG